MATSNVQRIVRALKEVDQTRERKDYCDILKIIVGLGASISSGRHWCHSD